MERVVAPQMAALFRDFSPHTYARMACVTCHGDGAKDGSYRMPNPDLPLTASDAATARSDYADPRSAFMVRQVEPAMARLLGRAPNDLATDTGHGCFSCHALDK